MEGKSRIFLWFVLVKELGKDLKSVILKKNRWKYIGIMTKM